ncbi:MAG: bifunctional (p)ppGpp synthetase/guanosine-3',5'-bis(diphosphate) 3'-pyrophosphohydrolase [Clostridia bacterium]|nr:(p)ppGpp synthetase [Bacillota bacterium]
MSLSVLIDKIKAYKEDADFQLIEKAYHFARRAHEGQFRDSGDVYFRHPYEVAKILADLELDVTTIAAGLLHDVLEDTEVTREQLEEEFGPEIVHLVDGVTKLSKIPFQTKEEHQAQSLRKMFLAMAEDLRVVLIKLADRLHNMRTLRHLPRERQLKVAKETLEIYTPLAHRLGMWSLKWEMEDLALRYLDPEGYYDLVRRIAKKRQEREGELEEIMKALRERLNEVGIPAEIQGRPKHFYSIYQKMKRQGKDLSEIYDLVAVRVIVDSIKDCYGVLGLVHTMWKPIPGRFKDYIAMPKSNMYQSLHTTVIGPRGEPVEIQIRTWEMHRIAEKGIAAHWLYKEGGKSGDFEEKVAWLRQVMEWLKEMRDPQEFMETLKIDLFEDEVFVFTPKGDVKSLPAGATPVDFAFAVHTDIGLHCAGAKVNGRLVPLDYRLSNGEFVEILTSKNATPSKDWLKFVKTSRARSKIRSWLKEQEREDIVERGRQMLEKELKRLGIEVKETLKPDRMAEVLKRYGYGAVDDLYAAVGYGKTSVNQVLDKLLGREELEARKASAKKPAGQKKKASSARGVLVKGMDDMLVRFSKCCSPVPGDAIVGYITRGRGVSIHRVDCPNVAALSGFEERKIEVEWQAGETGTFPVEIEVEAVDRVNLLSNIMSTISEGRTNIESVNARTTKNKMAIINLVVDIQDIEHMESVMNRIKQVSGVLAVTRAHPT